MPDPTPPEDQRTETTPFNPHRLLARLIDREHPPRQLYFDRLCDEIELKDSEIVSRFGEEWGWNFPRLEQEGVDEGVLASKEDRVCYSNVDFIKALIYLGDSLEVEKLEPYIPKIVRNLDMFHALSPQAKEAFRKGDDQDPLNIKTKEFLRKLFKFTKEPQGDSGPHIRP